MIVDSISSIMFSLACEGFPFTILHCSFFISSLCCPAYDQISRPVMATPTSIRFDGIILEGGGLKHPYGIPADFVEEVDGKIFFLASRRDRDLAKFMGLNMSNSAPWVTNPTLDYLCDLRNAKVDGVVSQLWDKVADPLADKHTSPNKRARRELVSKVPSVLELTIPAQGKSLNSFTLSVLAKSKRNDVFGFEIKEENFDHIRLMVANPPTACARRWMDKQVTAYSVDFPNVKLYIRDSTWRMEARRSGGERKCRGIPHTTDEVTWKVLADEVAQDLEAWCQGAVCDLDEE